MLRRFFGLMALAGGALGALVAYRARSGERRPRFDVHFDDGSLVSYGAGSPAGRRLLPHARDAVAAARRP